MSALNTEPAEMIGWPDFVDQVATFHRQVDDGQGTTIVLTANYGEAGAIDHHGAALGLPPAYSGHNSFADARVPPDSQGPVLVIGYGDPRRLLSGCTRLGAITMPYDVDNEEQGAPVWHCAGPLRRYNTRCLAICIAFVQGNHGMEPNDRGHVRNQRIIRGRTHLALNIGEIPDAIGRIQGQ